VGACAALVVACAAGPARARTLPPGHELRLDLAGTWRMVLDPGALGLEGDYARLLGEPDPSGPLPFDVMPVTVPGPIEQTRWSRDYDGIVWLARRFTAPAVLDGARVELAFERVNHLARVYVDGVLAGEHEGGYDPFAVDVTDLVRPGVEHALVVMVLDPGEVETLGLRLKTTPHAKESWYHNFGGILGDLALVVRRGPLLEYWELSGHADDGAIAVTASFAHAPPRPRGTARAELRVEGPDGASRARAIELAFDDEGRAHLELSVPVETPRAWTPKDPALYRVAWRADGHELDARATGLVGPRLVDGDWVVGGRRRVLKGVLWQPHFFGLGGMEPDAEALDAVVRHMLAAGFDFVRAHVRAAPEAFLDAADRHGLLVLEEPSIGWLEDDPAIEARMIREVDWMVRAHRHHPSIFAWGVLNEASGRAYRYVDAVAAHVASLDSTRPVLLDSGGFLGGGSLIPPGGEAPVGMTDSHQYPPYPLPRAALDAMRALGEPDELVFASEYGFGTIVEAEETARRLRDLGVDSAESRLFGGFTGTARRARERGETWGDWKAAADAVQAAAAVDMTEALRANPALDALCYTQWQAVSGESSAGLLTPWGDERPVLDALRAALAPRIVTLAPIAASVDAGGERGVTVTLVNDTGEAVEGRLEVRAAAGGDEAVVLRQDVVAPAGVRRLDLRWEAGLAAPDGVTTVSALWTDAAGALVDAATPRRITSVASRARRDDVRLAVVPGDERARAYAALRGEAVPVGPGPIEAAGAVVADLARLASLPVEQRRRLWELVWRGGRAVVLLEDPAADGLGRALGFARGSRTTTGLPVAVQYTSAPGNFQGRVHVLGTACGSESGQAPRALTRGDEVLSPAAMIVGGLPGDATERMITVGYLHNRMGVPIARVPFGAGAFELVGVPLLEPVPVPRRPDDGAWIETPGGGDAPGPARVHLAERAPSATDTVLDPRRLRLLDALLGLDDAPLELGPPAPDPPPGALAVLDAADAHLARIVDLSDRHSALRPGHAHPPDVAAGLEARERAWAALLGGGAEARGAALAELRSTVVPLWAEPMPGFAALADALIDRIRELIAVGSPAAWDVAYEILDCHARGLRFWFDGDPDTALAWLGRGELLAEEARGEGRVPNAGGEATPPERVPPGGAGTPADGGR